MGLPELIDACGPDFNLLEKEVNPWGEAPDMWIAIGRLGNVVTSGSTPEEAVERLRDALNATAKNA